MEVKRHPVLNDKFYPREPDSNDTKSVSMVRLSECNDKDGVRGDLNKYLQNSSYNSQDMELEPNVGLIGDTINQIKMFFSVGR